MRLSATILLFIFALGINDRCFADASSQIGTSQTEELLKRASEKGLSTDKYWLRLLHYAPHEFGIEFKSEVDDDKFFLSPRGKYDSSAELDATIRAFTSAVIGDDSERCRFIGRKHWLESELKVTFPEDDCKAYQNWIGALDPGSAAVIFPAAYLNNPASMFGHTFLRIDPKGQTGSQRLLSYAVNYGANTEEDPGIGYAIRGIFGGYQGYFSVLPYYVQVREYSDLESRDIWEYELSFSDADLHRLLAHLWELRGIAFDYYFFDENCSYHLLDLLEVARTDINLKERFYATVTPVDTIRALLENESLLRHAEFRPSTRTVLEDRLSTITEVEKEKALSLVFTDDADLNDPNIRPAETVDAALDYSAYLSFSRPKEQEHFTDKTYALSNLRSSLPADEVPRAPKPSPVRPDLGHDTARVTAIGGIAGGTGFSQLEFRPSYHDLMDPEPGYTKGAQIQFIDTAVRLKEDRLRLERVNVLDILSLGNRDEFFHPVSWSVTTGLERPRIQNGRDDLAAFLRIGAGFAYAPQPFLQIAILAGPALSEDFEETPSAGLGPHGIALIDLSDTFRLQLDAQSYQYFFRDEWLSTKLSSALRYTIAPDWVAEISDTQFINSSSTDRFNRTENEAQFALRRYF